ncbi:MAG: putative toxin-antitoxin system toxin component, PIN family [Candidatus Omnitrophica bacterium]|nr:putative toxin-antitoxin system toxin component, PIN family [Candidatus Omnitrophota bacterium]
MRRVVLDANVYVGAMVSAGVCRSIVHSLKDDPFAVFISPPLLEDLLRALEKPKLKRLISPEFLEEIISLIHMKAVIIEPKVKIRASRDPADDAVLECAHAAKASIIVSGDKDLLVLSPFKNIAILSPSTFARRLKIRRSS